MDDVLFGHDVLILATLVHTANAPACQALEGTVMVMVVEVIPPLSLFLLRFLLLILLLLVGLEVVVHGVMHHLHFNINHCNSSSTADNNRQASCGQDREK